MDLESFERAADRLQQFVSSRGTSAVPQQRLLYLYARYKQATAGPCGTARPGLLQFSARAKWDVWRELGEMTARQARLEYVRAVEELVASSGVEGGSSGGFGVSVSRPLEGRQTAAVSEADLDLCELAQCGRLTPLVDRWSGGCDVDLNARDSVGLTPLLWAADRGHLRVLQWLLDVGGAHLQQYDERAQTALHYAACCGHAPIVAALLARGASVDVRDSDGLTPRDVADPEVIQLFDEVECQRAGV